MKPIAAEDAAEREPGEHFPPHDAPPVSEPDLAERQRANHQRRGLRTRVAAARDDQRDEQRQHDRLRESRASKAPIAVAVSISPRNSAVNQPARLRIMRPERDFHVRLVECLRSADALDFLGRRRFRDVEHVVDRDDADQHAGGVGDRQRRAVVAAERGDRGLLVVGRFRAR